MTTQALTGLIAGAFGRQEGPVLDAGRKAAQQLIDGIGTYFDDSLRSLPQLAQMSPADWTKIRSTSEMQAHALLAYSAALKKDTTTAETEYNKVLAIDPTQATTSYQLGASIIHEMMETKNFVRYSEALYDLARSLSVEGPNALPPAIRAAAEKALKANYPNYHGSLEGLDDLLKQSANSALPPAGFHIPSIVDIDEAKQRDHAAWALEHPDLDFWETIRAEVEAQGDSFFNATLKDVVFPPSAGDAYKGPPMFRGIVVSVPTPQQILVNVDNAAGDALLHFDGKIKGDIPAGTAIRFKGVIESHTNKPSYLLTLNVEEPKTDIAGLPDGVTFVPGAAAAPKPGGRGKAAPKPLDKTAK